MTMSRGQNAMKHVGCQRLRVGSKKSAQQGHSHFLERSVHLVREHRKMARTTLAAFFNRPTRLTTGSVTPQVSMEDISESGQFSEWLESRVSAYNRGQKKAHACNSD